MPSIPRKTYCQRCKDRRVKCDQNWPTCSGCMRKGLECPGPTSLVKFVTNNRHKVEKDKEPTSSSQSKNLKNTSLVSSGGVILMDRPSQVAPKVTGHGSKFMSYRLTNVWNHRVTMNSCDRITARLATLMHASPEQSMILFKPLRALPTRLLTSKCLQYGVAYWCSTWVDFNCGLGSPSITSWNYYGKLLRSLQNAIDGPERFSVETLAASILLFKAGDHFNLETHTEKRSVLLQVLGITAMVKHKGPPNYKDPLDALLSYECEIILAVVGGFPVPDADFYGAPEWVEARIKALEQVVISDGGREIDMLILTNDVKQTGRDAGPNAMRKCNNDPGAHADDADALIERHLLFLAEFEALFPEHWEYAQKTYGKITEVDDPDFFVGKRFNVENHKAFTTLLSSLEAPLITCVMISQLRELYHKPPNVYFEALFRKYCLRMWMFIPYLRAQDALSIEDKAISAVVHSTDRATEQEMEHLVDFIQLMDVTHDFPETREAIIMDIGIYIGMAKGTTPPLQPEIAEWMMGLSLT